MTMTELEYENIKLREDCDRLVIKLNVEHIVRQNVEIENAKLRELCADIYEMAYYEYPSAFETAFAERMRELRVGVN